MTICSTCDVLFFCVWLVVRVCEAMASEVVADASPSVCAEARYATTCVHMIGCTLVLLVIICSDLGVGVVRVCEAMAPEVVAWSPVIQAAPYIHSECTFESRRVLHVMFVWLCYVYWFACVRGWRFGDLMHGQAERWS